MFFPRNAAAGVISRSTLSRTHGRPDTGNGIHRCPTHPPTSVVSFRRLRKRHSGSRSADPSACMRMEVEETDRAAPTLSNYTFRSCVSSWPPSGSSWISPAQFGSVPLGAFLMGSSSGTRRRWNGPLGCSKSRVHVGRPVGNSNVEVRSWSNLLVEGSTQRKSC